MSIRTAEREVTLELKVYPESEKEVEVLSMRNRSHREFAVSEVMNGNVVALRAIQYGAIFQANSEEQVQRHLFKVKGTERKSPVAVWLRNPEDLINSGIVDFVRIHPELQDMFFDPNLFEHLTQGYCMVRFPIIDEGYLNGVALHDNVTSENESGKWFQVFYMGKNQLSSHQFADDIYTKEVGLAAITSLNLSGEAPPSNNQQAEEFCRQQDISALIIDRKSSFVLRKDSYPIIEVNQEGAFLKRRGNIHPKLLESLGWPLQYDGLEEPREDPSILHQLLFKWIATEAPVLANPLITMEAQG